MSTTNTQPSSVSFTIEGSVSVAVTVTELDDGSLKFDLSVLDDQGTIGDLNGLFFDMLDPTILDGLSSDGADITKEAYDAGDVTNLGGGVNMNGELTSAGGYDVGIRFGTSGMAKDDIQETSFVLSHSDIDLVLEDILGQDFGVRLTSVGEIDGSRDDSLKLGTTSPEVVDDPIIDDPIIDDEPVIDEEPILEDPPVIDGEPVLEDPPVIDGEPVLEDPTVIDGEPTVEDVPVVEEEPVVVDEIIIDGEPTSDPAIQPVNEGDILSPDQLDDQGPEQTYPLLTDDPLADMAIPMEGEDQLYVDPIEEDPLLF